MREKLHDIIHFETGEVLGEEMWPVDVAIYLKRNPNFTVHHVEQDDGPWHPDDTPVDTAWVAGDLSSWDPSARPVGLYV
jgi:hypothetical protein